jgi:hypothetical protein
VHSLKRVHTLKFLTSFQSLNRDNIT